MNKNLVGAIAASAMVVTISSARADTIEYIQNGTFESVTGGIGLITNGNVATSTSVSNWTGSGYTFVFSGSTADSTGAPGNPIASGNITLYGPQNSPSVANGLGASPDGGNFIAADGDFAGGGEPTGAGTAGVSQNLTNLIIGVPATVSFYWAASQQTTFDGPTTQYWQVQLGDLAAQVTASVSIPDQGFSGWQTASMTFTPDSTNATLSFLAFGSDAIPPFALLDGVSVTQTYTPNNNNNNNNNNSPPPNDVPEPGSLLLLATGLAGAAGFVRRRKLAAA